MFTKRKTFNPKRSIVADSRPFSNSDLSNVVRYGGNPEHKKNPGDFGLTPPASPRPDKTLCDLAGITRRADAVALLQDGIRRGLVSEQARNKYPQNVWAVTVEGIPMEAQLENSESGTYHGYPMQNGDPFRNKVLERWGKDDA